MVTEEQTNQNPEISTQDENSEKLADTKKNVSKKSVETPDQQVQIDNDLKKEIVELYSGWWRKESQS